MKKKICIIFGGESTEYEISLRSAYSVITNIDKEKYEIITVGITKDGMWYLYDGDYDNIPKDMWYNDSLPHASVMYASKESALCVSRGDGCEKIEFDVAFPVLHGKNGEDGTIQGLFELAGIKYVGVGVLTSAVGMDKPFTKIVFQNAGIPQADWIVIGAHEMDMLDEKVELIEKKLGYPAFIKPANAGSSIGIGKAKNRDELIAAIKEAIKYDRKVLVEEFLTGREVECAVIGSRGNIFASCVGEIVASDEFYTYDAKYSSTSTSKLYIPAEIESKYADQIKDYAIKAFEAIDGKGLSRVDFFADEQKGKVWLNEINTMPGFTSISMYPKLMEASGICYKDILTKLIEIALS